MVSVIIYELGAIELQRTLVPFPLLSSVCMLDNTVNMTKKDIIDHSKTTPITIDYSFVPE